MYSYCYNVTTVSVVIIIGLTSVANAFPLRAISDSSTKPCHSSINSITVSRGGPSYGCQASSLPVLRMGNIFDDLGKYFNNNNSNDDDDRVNDDNNDDDDDDDDEEFVGSTRIISIPVKEIKPGGLRLFLMLYLLGEQNKPEKGSWVVDQPTTDEYSVDFYYHDHTAALMIRLRDNNQNQIQNNNQIQNDQTITIDRMGSAPSNSYIMQESVVVDGILEELQRMVDEADVKPEDRLLVLEQPDSIEAAREELSFG